MLNNERGIATIEIVPIIAIFVLMLNFALGFFGVVHSGILNSIAARNYAFETFRNRANLNYLRDFEAQAEASKEGYYNKAGFRFHGVTHETRQQDLSWVPTKRPIKFSELSSGLDIAGTKQEHNQLISQIADNKKASDVFTGKGRDDGKSGVDPVWVKTLYGICLNSTCKRPSWSQ